MKLGKKRVYQLIAIVCLLVAIVAGIYVIRNLIVQSQADDMYEELQSQVSVIESEPLVEITPEPLTPSPEVNATEEPAVTYEEEMYRLVDFKELQENTNADIYAWIYIPDTHIDYPIVQHPTDNTRYLNYNLDGSKGYPGCIYTEKENAKDFSDFQTVIYGHNMKNGTMFHDLHLYKEQEFFDEHPYIYVYLENGRTLKYQIFAAYKHNDSHLLYAYDYSNTYLCGQYLEDVVGQRNMSAVVNADVDLSGESSIITLSTCVGGEATKRYLVQAVMVEDVTFDVSQLGDISSEGAN